MHIRLTLLHALTTTFGLFLTTAFAEEAPPRHLFVLSGQSNITPTLADSFENCVEQALGKERVIVTRTGRQKALHVRMGWALEDVINLTNKEGLPASAFRTDG